MVHDVSPSAPGGKDWCRGLVAATRLLYMPHLNMSMDLEQTEVNYIAGTPYVGRLNEKFYLASEGHMGEFTAWDPVEAKQSWQIHEKFPVWSG